jgi:chromosome segregation ATPase
MKLNHEQNLQVMDMQIGKCTLLQKHMQMNIEEALKTLHDVDMQLDAFLSPQKTYLEALPMHVEKCFTKYRYIGKTSSLEEVAYSIRNKLKLLQKNINNEDNRITHQEHVHEEITRIKAHFEKEEAEYYQNIYKLRRELQEKDAHLSQLKDRLINVDAKHSLNEQEIINSERRLTESKEESYHIEHELCQLKKNNEYLKNEIGRREVKLREHEVERVQMVRKLKDSNKQVILMQTKNAELQRDSAKYDQIKNDLETQIENMNKKYVTVKGRQVKLTMEKDKIISELNQTVIELKRKTSDLKDTEKSLYLEIRDKDNRISMLYNELDKYTKMVKKKEIELEREMENKLQIFKSNLNKDSNFYETEIARKDEMLVKTNEGKSKMEAIVKALREEVKAKDAKINVLTAELQQRLEHHNKTQKHLEDVISSKDKLVLDLEKTVQQRNDKVSSLGKKLEQDFPGKMHCTENKTDTTVTNEIRDLKKQLNHTFSKLHDTQAELDDTKTR